MRRTIILTDEHIQRLVLAEQLDNILSCKERQVVQALANGETARMIAAKLVISTSTVQSHIARVIQKGRFVYGKQATRNIIVQELNYAYFLKSGEKLD